MISILKLKKLGIWLTGQKIPENWNSSDETTSFYTLKGLVETLLSRLGLNKNLSTKALSSDTFGRWV